MRGDFVSERKPKLSWPRYFWFLALCPLVWIIQAFMAYFDPASIDDGQITHRERWKAAAIEMRGLNKEIFRVARERG